MAKKNPFDPEVVRKERTFPTMNIVWIVLLVVLQILIFLPIFLYHPQPQDRIREYSVTVNPRTDGTLDIDYRLTWKAIDPDEPLTWVEIGVPNENFTIVTDYTSDNIALLSLDAGTDDDGNKYAYACVDFKNSYQAGDVLTFSFRLHQKDMLCRDADGTFYEFTPGWFNETPVDHYTFRWRADGATANTEEKRLGYYVWEGSLDCGDTVTMRVSYPLGTFQSAAYVTYEQPTINSHNALKGRRIAVCVFCVIGIVLLCWAEFWIVDSFVSYHRGRGFIRRYGHRVHQYGRTNPAYSRERNRRAVAHGGHGGHGGCACACACACAGGGRAGCSQKDTTAFPVKKSVESDAPDTPV